MLGRSSARCRRVRGREPACGDGALPRCIGGSSGSRCPVTASYIIARSSPRRRSASSACRTTPPTCSSSTTRCCPEVAPPTALSPFAGDADHRRRSVPDDAAVVEVHAARFVVPFVFVLDPAGVVLLLKVPSDASWGARRVDRIHGDRRASSRLPRASSAGCCARARRSSGGCSSRCGLLLVYPAPQARLGRPRRLRRAARVAAVRAAARAGRRRSARCAASTQLFARYARVAPRSGEQGDPLGVRAADHVVRHRVLLGVVAGRRVRVHRTRGSRITRGCRRRSRSACSA